MLKKGKEKQLQTKCTEVDNAMIFFCAEMGAIKNSSSWRKEKQRKGRGGQEVETSVGGESGDGGAVEPNS